MAFQEPEFTSEMGLRQRQRIVDILFNIVTGSTPLSPDNSDYLTGEQKVFVLVFIVDEVVECTVNLESSSLQRVVEMLCVEVGDEQKPRRETAILKLLHGNKLSHIPEAKLLDLTRRANFLRVLEQLHTSRRDWESVCECLIAEPTRHSEVLPLLQQLPTIQLNEIAKRRTAELVDIDATGFASILAARLPDQLDDVLASLRDKPDHEYALLLALHSCMEPTSERKEPADEFDDKSPNDLLKPQLSQDTLERLLRLMCDIQPDKVLQHLQGSHGCHPERARQIMQEVKRKDAEALLLEQSGNYRDAFELLLDRLNEITNVNSLNEPTEEEAVRVTSQLAGLCRRSAGVLDWLPLVNVVLGLQSNNGVQKTNKTLGEKLLKIILESLSGTTALSSVLEHILKQPLSTGGTMGDVRQLLSGVLAQSRYEQVLVETTARLVSLELHEALKKSLREAGKARSISSLICTMCKGPLASAADCVVIFSCNHTYHIECLSEQKVCYECLNTKGWAHPVTEFLPPTSRSSHSTSEERGKLEPPAFMQNKFSSLRLAPPVPWPDLDDIL